MNTKDSVYTDHIAEQVAATIRNDADFTVVKLALLADALGANVTDWLAGVTDARAEAAYVDGVLDAHHGKRSHADSCTDSDLRGEYERGYSGDDLDA